jgi:membrane-associated phospholipid phosphatase
MNVRRALPALLPGLAVVLWAAMATAETPPPFPDWSPLPPWLADAPTGGVIVAAHAVPFGTTPGGAAQVGYLASCTEPLTVGPAGHGAQDSASLAPPEDAAWFDSAPGKAGDAPPLAPLPADALPSAPPSFVPGLPETAGSPGANTPRRWYSRPRQLLFDIRSDYRNYYTWHHAALLGVAFSGGAIMANTQMDQNFRDYYQRQVGYNGTIHAFHIFGEGAIMVPSYLAVAALGWVFDDYVAVRTVGRWGEQSFRAIAVGAPPMLLMQEVTGGSRPTDGTYGSHWHPFQDNNGVSGHSFMGAVPFLTAARMSDRPLLRATFFAGSFLTGLSRVGDDKHYLSQTLLGWAMAGVAVSAVGQTETGQPFRLVPWANPGGMGFGYEWRR